MQIPLDRQTYSSGIDVHSLQCFPLKGIDEFCTSAVMMNVLDCAVNQSKAGEKTPSTQVRKLTIWLAGCLLHTNAQRPGAITNAKLSEFANSSTAMQGRETYTTFNVEHHKTRASATAKITMNEHMTKLIQKYVNHI